MSSTSWLRSAYLSALACIAFVREVSAAAIEAIFVLLESIQIAPSIELDALAHQTRLVPADDSLMVKAMAFLRRALRHKRFTAGGFAIDPVLSAA